MKLWLMAVLGVVLLAGQVNAGDDVTLKEHRDKVGYSVGMDIGSNLKDLSVDMNPDMLARGIKDAFSGDKPLMTDQEMSGIMENFKKDVMAKRREHSKVLAEKNKKEGAAFLAENSKKEGVVTLPSGLQYRVIKEGTGEKPKLTDSVTTHYRGTLIDGTEFDSSYSRGKPATFPVKGVIPGWTEALQLMKVGSKWEVFVPAGLAYGERGAGRSVGPNSALIFDIELLSIAEKEESHLKK